jgi:hypothetical protein
MAKFKKKHIRWAIPEDIHAKIATYQKSNSISTMESAGIRLLKKITQQIKKVKV